MVTLLLFAALAAAPACALAAEAAEAKAPPKDLVITTLAGITVDTKAREVRLQGTVVLREGPLELFVCSEGTREHESVIAVRAQPADVTFALALLGLAPGKPGYTTEGGAFSPPAGEVLAITCRFQGADGKTHEVPAHRLLRLAGSESGLDRTIDWVYVGRAETEALRAANREGTVVCLSNFREAVIDVPFESTSDNAALVYEANPKVVPAPGTAVELVLRPEGRRIEPKKVQVEIVLETGKPPRLDGKEMDFETLARTVSSLPAVIRTTVLRVDPEEKFGRVMKVQRMLADALMQVHLALYEPKAEGPPPEAKPPLEASLDADDRVTAAGRTMPVAEFCKTVADLLGNADRLHLRAGPGASPRSVAEIMAAARDAGAGVTLSRGAQEGRKP
jgi:biopolymer transport protein ExbD